MRFYGTIETNLIEICKNKGILDLGYSVDSLLFETEDGETFSIDFEEGDYGVEDDCLTFRLKSLGITFEESWEGLYRTIGIDIENDAPFFKTLTLKSIGLYIPEHEGLINEDLEQLECEVIEAEIVIGEENINYETVDVEVEL